MFLLLRTLFSSIGPNSSTGSFLIWLFVKVQRQVCLCISHHCSCFSQAGFPWSTSHPRVCEDLHPQTAKTGTASRGCRYAEMGNKLNRSLVNHRKYMNLQVPWTLLCPEDFSFGVQKPTKTLSRHLCLSLPLCPPPPTSHCAIFSIISFSVLEVLGNGRWIETFDLPASTSLMTGLQECATMTCFNVVLWSNPGSSHARQTLQQMRSTPCYL